MAIATAFESTEPTAAEIRASRGSLLLEFGTPWCGYCRAAQPLLASALHGFEAIPHLKIEDGRGRPLGRAYRIKLWPTLIFLRDGAEVSRLVRPESADAILEQMRQLLVPVSA